MTSTIFHSSFVVFSTFEADGKLDSWKKSVHNRLKIKVSNCYIESKEKVKKNNFGVNIVNNV